VMIPTTGLCEVRRCDRRTGVEWTRRRVYDFVRVFYAVLERPPTGQEIADGLSIAPTTVFYHLKRLRADGALRVDGAHRVTRRDTRANTPVRVVGSVQ
jgi:predicted transcriptional regulator